MELSLVLPFILGPRRNNNQVQQAKDAGIDCKDWPYRCDSTSATRVMSICLAVFVWLYCLQFYWYYLHTRRQLRKKPYTENRAPNILMRLQVSWLC